MLSKDESKDPRKKPFESYIPKHPSPLRQAITVEELSEQRSPHPKTNKMETNDTDTMPKDIEKRMELHDEFCSPYFKHPEQFQPDEYTPNATPLVMHTKRELEDTEMMDFVHKGVDEDVEGPEIEAAEEKAQRG